ncbi:MAG: PKD domain-containing protein [Bacteroidales bacterium]
MKPFRLFMILAVVALMQGCYKDPVANFEYSYVDNMAPADVTFTNLSTEADKFQWDFGDGSSSTEEHPEHAFYNWLNPNVTLVAKGRGGENRITKTIGLTSYYLKNSSSVTLYNSWTFFYDGQNIVDDFDLGTLSPGYNSDVVITTHTVIDVAFELVDGIMYLVEYSYTLNKNAASYLDITDETTIIEVTGKKKSTLSQPDLKMIRENGQRMLLKDLMAQ